MSKKLTRYLNWIGVPTKGAREMIYKILKMESINHSIVTLHLHEILTAVCVCVCSMQCLTWASTGVRPCAHINPSTSSDTTMLRP